MRELRERRLSEGAFGGRPPVVGAFGDDVELFPGVVSDVGAEEPAVGGEAAAPWVTESQRPDLAARPGLSDEGVVRGNRAGAVEAQDLAVQRS